MAGGGRRLYDAVMRLRILVVIACLSFAPCLSLGCDAADGCSAELATCQDGCRDKTDTNERSVCLSACSQEYDICGGAPG